jgi:hypothetical protein
MEEKEKEDGGIKEYDKEEIWGAKKKLLFFCRLHAHIVQKTIKEPW